MKIRVVRKQSEKTWQPDRSRGKRFRTRPRSARGTWELEIGGKKKKATPTAPMVQKNRLMDSLIRAYRGRGK